MHLYRVFKWTAFVAVLIVIPLSWTKEQDDFEDHDVGKRALRLEHRLSTLEDKLKERGEKGKQLFQLEKRLREHEDDPLKHKNLRVCDYKTNQCVHKLLFCDGFADCENEFDEAHCDVPFKHGDVFHGELIYNHCSQKVPPFAVLTFHNLDKTVSYATKFKVNVYVDPVFFPIKGFYDPSSRTAFIETPSGSRDELGFVAIFDEYNRDTFHGFLGSYAHSIRCAKYAFRKASPRH